jgi:hypothetical protein
MAFLESTDAAQELLEGLTWKRGQEGIDDELMPDANESLLR